MPPDPRVDRQSVLDSDDLSKGNAVASALLDFLYDGDPDERMGLLSPSQRAVVLMQAVLADVLNGGYWQFFGNSAGGYLHELPGAARTLAAPEYAEHFERVVATLGVEHLPRDSYERDALLDSLPEELDERIEPLDSELEDLNDRRDLLDEVVWPYVEAHQDEFFRPTA